MIFLEAYILNEQTIVNINELKYLFLKSKDINISVFKMSVFFCWVAVPSNLAPAAGVVSKPMLGANPFCIDFFSQFNNLIFHYFRVE